MKNPLLCAVALCVMLALATATRLEIHRRPFVLEEMTKRRAISPLGGSIGNHGLFFVDIEVGGQPQRVSLDTGSSILYVAATNCVDTDTQQTCAHVNEYYDPSKSSTAQYASCTACSGTCDGEKCAVGTVYADMSTARAYVTSDRITVGNASVIANFGALYEVSGQFLLDLGINGLWGLAYTALADGLETVFDAYVRQGVYSNVFSMCLSSTGGILVLGEVDTTLQTGATQWAALGEHHFYEIDLQSVQVGGNAIATTMPTTIVDSGTTLISMPSAMYTAIKQRIQSNCNLPFVGCGGGPSIFDLDKCWDMSAAQRAQYPTLRFALAAKSSGTIQLDLTPAHYIIETSSTTGAVCYTVGFATSDDSMLVLGDVFMQAFHVIFDRANDQIGFAPVNPTTCNGRLSDLPQLQTSAVTNWVAIGIVIAIAAVLVLVGALVGVYFYCKRQKKSTKPMELH